MAERTMLKVGHVYEHDARKFEDMLNQLFERILEQGGTIGDIKYASDAPTQFERRGGFGALVIYEVPLGT